MNKMYLTNLGYITLGEAKTSGYSFFQYRGEYFPEFIKETREIIKGDTRPVHCVFDPNKNEKIALPLRFIFGENIDI